MGRRILTVRPDVDPADGDTTPVNMPSDLQPVYAMAVGGNSEPGSYRVKASNMDEFILDCHHPFIGEDGGGSLRLNPPIIITPNWLPVNTPGHARVAAVDLMLYDRVPNWLPSRRAVLVSATPQVPTGQTELFRSIICQGRKRVTVMTRSSVNGQTIRYFWTSFQVDGGVVSGQYPFTDVAAALSPVIREIASPVGYIDASPNNHPSGMPDMITVSISGAEENSPGMFVLEAYDD